MRNALYLLFVILPSLLWGQKEKMWLNDGNQAYQNGAYAEAEENYRKSVEKNPDYLPGAFNLGNSYFRQEKYEEAAMQYELAAKKAETNDAQAKAYHNLGNALFRAQKLEPCIEAYKNALKLNPNDEETRYNLALAKRLQKKQQQQQQQQQQNQDQNQDQNKEQQKQENQQDQQDRQNQKQQQQDQQQKEQQKDQQQKDGEQQQPPKPQDGQKDPQQMEKRKAKISEEEAKRLLEALQYQEKNTQEKLKNKRLKKGERVKIEKDW